MASAQQDLLHVLAREHRDHSAAFHEMIDHGHETTLRQRRRQFASLMLHLSIHVTAERLVVHPLVVTALDRGDEIRQTREREIHALWEQMTETGGALEDPERLLAALQEASRQATSHADREELEIFVHVRHVATPKQLRRMGRLHAMLGQRLAARYQREGDAPSEPWADPGLLDVLASWYTEELPVDEPEVIVSVPDPEPRR